jgi:hypothetical protein
MKQLPTAGFVAFAAFWLLDCSANRVPSRVLGRLPYESKIELLEAENDLALAVDHLEEARNEVTRHRAAIRRAKDRLSAAEDEEGSAKDAPSKDVARLSVVEAKARLEYLRAQQRVNEETEHIQEVGLECARARFELARVDIARKAKVEGSESLDPQSFENQVKNCEGEVAKLQKDLKEPSQKARASKEAWDNQRAVLAKKTFDARASPYVE